MALLAPILFAQPFEFVGDVDAPDPARTHSGVVLVRGWAYDPSQISRIELWVDDQFIHNAVMFIPRIELQDAFPDWPGLHNARPGFTTGFLASRFPDGPHTVEIRVFPSNGDMHTLGRRTIQINNSINQSPFGALDIPDNRGITNVSGAFPVVGWAADTDGVQVIEVLVDDGILQSAIHGDARPDVGATYFDFEGAMFSGYVANIDSTRLQNGVHTLTVRARDNKGMTALIGRRTVQVINNDQFLKPFGYLDEPLRDATLFGTGCGDDAGPIVSPPVDPNEHITIVRGWALDLGTRQDPGRVAYAELLVDGVPWISTDDCAAVAGRFDNCYGLPRYDVARYYPTFPDAPRAGFLFTLDVGMLMNIGVSAGSHNLMVRVGDREQTFTELPNRDGIPVFFQCVDDDFDFVAIGHIDYPTKSDFIGGTATFRGWAVEDQSTLAGVEIFVDGLFMGTAQWGFPRPDVGDFYPQIGTADFSGWQFNMDTRKLANSIHRLTVRVRDSGGRTSEIGSTDFYVFNNNPQP
ncbi:MAG TPA: Ig-like domain-containing protein [Thermoanaerobaculia bacterium]|nr:Ig-like domain-containing protein [Thermoanaerobaculia bacterium]